MAISRPCATYKRIFIEPLRPTPGYSSQNLQHTIWPHLWNIYIYKYMYSLRYDKRCRDTGTLLRVIYLRYAWQLLFINVRTCSFRDNLKKNCTQVFSLATQDINIEHNTLHRPNQHKPPETRSTACATVLCQQKVHILLLLAFPLQQLLHGTNIPMY